jgi:hypothetical protein
MLAVGVVEQEPRIILAEQAAVALVLLVLMQIIQLLELLILAGAAALNGMLAAEQEPLADLAL